MKPRFVPGHGLVEFALLPDWTTALLVVGALASCHSERGRGPCGGPCPDGFYCREEVDTCVREPARLDTLKHPAEQLDCHVEGETLQVLLFERLGGVFLFGTQSPARQSPTFESVTSETSVPRNRVPVMQILTGLHETTVLVEPRAGHLDAYSRGFDGWRLGWSWSLPSALEHLSAAASKNGSIHLCVSDSSGVLHYGVFREGKEVPVQPISRATEPLTPTGPCQVLSLSDRTLILAAARPSGLVSLSFTDESGWKTTVLDPHVLPVSLAVDMDERGLLLVVLDGVSGQLLVRWEETPTAVWSVLDPDAFGKRWGMQRVSPSVHLTRQPNSRNVLVTYFDCGASMATALQGLDGNWTTLARQELSGAAVIRLAVLPSGDLLAPALVLGERPEAPPLYATLPMLVSAP